MGSISARKCYQILKNVQTVIAIELLCGAQGVEFLKPLKCGEGTRIAYNKIRRIVKPLAHDRELHIDISKILTIIKDNSLLKTVEKQVTME
jgi:histidine ammonia-lyase